MKDLPNHPSVDDGVPVVLFNTVLPPSPLCTELFTEATRPHVQWEAVIVDEGHRLKNEQSRLTAALATLRTRARFLLTGTPLQNRLGELWALLNFILPSVFSCSDSFDAWFGGAFGGSASVRFPPPSTSLRCALPVPASTSCT